MCKEKITSGKTYLGIELGSTRIKACLIDDDYAVIASGGYEWENRYENGYWTYSMDDIHKGIKGCFADLCANIEKEYSVKFEKTSAIGISGMMHGFLAFDKDDNLLTPFRTWRNTTTADAASKLSELFAFNVPQRWSISHLYQAILNDEPYVKDIAHITTLAGYIHYLLTGERELGVGEASGMFPITDNDYDKDMLAKFSSLIKDKNFDWTIEEILPKVKVAGDKGTVLSEEGAAFIDERGMLVFGIPMCPPEGDAGTGMVATNAVLERTGNVSAGTSIFGMLVLEKALKNVYSEIDVVTTPAGSPVAMVHCNNCCGELDAFVKLFGEFAALAGTEMDKSKLYGLLYKNALNGDEDCGGITAYNYLSGEHITGIEKGSPMYFRTHDSKMNLANFMKAELYSAMATLKIGMEILMDKEQAKADKFLGHGGLFKVQGVAQQILSNALNTKVSVMETASEGGAWGMALLAAYMLKKEGESLGEWLEKCVFSNMSVQVTEPEENGVCGFNEYIKRYKIGLGAQQALEKV
ncbi:MAG: ATPase [Ruminococcaceae bacterium]|nr:ATPase [Oscillospiraceae bacterium]